MPRIYFGPINSNHVDLFPWRANGERLLPDAPLDEWPGMGGRAGFPRSYLETTGTVVLYGREFPAPSPVDRFLVEHRYGPDYLTPRPQAWFMVYPDVPPDELSSGVEDLLERVTEADARLLELLAGERLARLRPMWIWAATGLPLAPPRARVETLRGALGEGAATPTVDAVLQSLALLEHAVEELEGRPRGLVLRHAYRRAVRARELLAAALTRRPHHAGFPFGVA